MEWIIQAIMSRAGQDLWPIPLIFVLLVIAKKIDLNSKTITPFMVRTTFAAIATIVIVAFGFRTYLEVDRSYRKPVISEVFSKGVVENALRSDVFLSNDQTLYFAMSPDAIQETRARFSYLRVTRNDELDRHQKLEFGIRTSVRAAKLSLSDSAQLNLNCEDSRQDFEYSVLFSPEQLKTAQQGGLSFRIDRPSTGDPCKSHHYVLRDQLFPDKPPILPLQASVPIRAAFDLASRSGSTGTTVANLLAKVGLVSTATAQTTQSVEDLYSELVRDSREGRVAAIRALSSMYAAGSASAQAWTNVQLESDATPFSVRLGIVEAMRAALKPLPLAYPAPPEINWLSAPALSRIVLDSLAGDTNQLGTSTRLFLNNSRDQRVSEVYRSLLDSPSLPPAVRSCIAVSQMETLVNWGTISGSDLAKGSAPVPPERLREIDEIFAKARSLQSFATNEDSVQWARVDYQKGQVFWNFALAQNPVVAPSDRTRARTEAAEAFASFKNFQERAAGFQQLYRYPFHVSIVQNMLANQEFDLKKLEPPTDARVIPAKSCIEAFR